MPVLVFSLFLGQSFVSWHPIIDYLSKCQLNCEACDVHFVEEKLKMSYRSKSLLVIILIFISINIYAQNDNRNFWGTRLGVYTDGSNFFVGGEYLTPINRNIDFNPNIEYIFVDNLVFLTFNFDVQHDFTPWNDMIFWAGGGIALLYVNPDHADSETDIGLNLSSTLSFEVQNSLFPYVQAKIILSDNSNFAIGFGLRF